MDRAVCCRTLLMKNSKYRVFFQSKAYYYHYFCIFTADYAKKTLITFNLEIQTEICKAKKLSARR